ncbi:hypothetical protein MLD52_20745 [Puniceicoccaceae bacterium K14]|nr:hypothetical protein [Puniceicoccaceae bacterium K14]
MKKLISTILAAAFLNTCAFAAFRGYTLVPNDFVQAAVYVPNYATSVSLYVEAESWGGDCYVSISGNMPSSPWLYVEAYNYDFVTDSTVGPLDTYYIDAMTIGDAYGYAYVGW